MEHNVTRSLITFKSGKFVFSRKYSAEKTGELMTKAAVLYQIVADLPILPDQRDRLNREILVKSVYSTAATEGNPTNERKVAGIIERTSQAAIDDPSEAEIINLVSAYEFVGQTSRSPVMVSEDLIKKLHQAVTRGIGHKHNVPGYYRKEKVQVGSDTGGGAYVPPVVLDDIQNLMKMFTVWLDSPEVCGLNPIVKAALAHYHLALIHPFSDGNGRVSRLTEMMFLKAARLRFVPAMLAGYYYSNISDYYRAFTESEKSGDHDVTPFIEFVLRGHIACLEEIKGKMIGLIRRSALRDHFSRSATKRSISGRQRELLRLLLDHREGFTLGDLARVPPMSLLYKTVCERTARRDLQKLHKDKFLLLNKDGKYVLNERVLD